MEGEIALMIPILGILLGFFGVWTNHRRKIARIEASALAQNTAGQAGHHAAGNREPEERVRVLERIVTDGGYNVASQIEALRDARQVADQRGQDTCRTGVGPNIGPNIRPSIHSGIKPDTHSGTQIADRQAGQGTITRKAQLSWTRASSPSSPSPAD